MEKVKRITIEQLRSANKTPTHRTVLWHGIAVTVRTLLLPQELSQFVNSVMDSCYDKTHNAFVPEMKDFAFRFNTVARYACVDLPDDIEEQYSILYNTDIYDVVLSAINAGQIQSLQETINALMFHTS